MADFQGVVGDITGSLFGSTLMITLWVVVGLMVVAVVGGLMWYFIVHKKKFDILIKIISKRSGGDKVYFDNGAILKDKRNNTDYLKLWNSKVELELPKFSIMYNTNRGDYLELVRESEKGFKFLASPKIDKEWIIGHDGKRYPFARMKHRQIESDLTWVLERLKTNKKLINPENLLMKILSYAPQIISMAFSLIIVWIVFRYAPQLLISMKQVIEAGSGGKTEVIGGLIPLLFIKWK